MPGTGVYAQIVQAVYTQVVRLRLVFKNALAPVWIAKKLGTKDNQSKVFGLRIVAEGRETNERLWGDTWWYEVRVLVGFIAAGKLELAGNLTGDLGSYLDWRESLANSLLEPTALGLTFVANVETDYEPVLDEQEIERGLDVSAVGFTFRCLRDGPNAG